MSPWLLLGLTLFLLWIPRCCLSPVESSGSAMAKPEIHGLLRVFDAIIRFYCALMHRLVSNGPAPLPARGPAILISNHTCGIDHLLLQAACRRVLGFMIAREYYEWKWIHNWCKYAGCIPVNRNGHDVA